MVEEVEGWRRPGKNIQRDIQFRKFVDIRGQQHSDGLSQLEARICWTGGKSRVCLVCLHRSVHQQV